MAHIYISYAPENFEYAEDVQRHLERSGFSVFIDSSSTEVPEGTVTAKDWRQEIDDAIRDSFALITLLTPHAKHLNM